MGITIARPDWRFGRRDRIGSWPACAERGSEHQSPLATADRAAASGLTTIGFQLRAGGARALCGEWVAGNAGTLVSPGRSGLYVTSDDGATELQAECGAATVIWPTQIGQSGALGEGRGVAGPPGSSAETTFMPSGVQMTIASPKSPAIRLCPGAMPWIGTSTWARKANSMNAVTTHRASPCRRASLVLIPYERNRCASICPDLDHSLLRGRAPVATPIEHRLHGHNR